ncbi:Uncharacterized protein Adt_04225 [Abeliophyllum distichum]|uniref:Uncharacterized protein n=1 Tax=Abeliophyllum distichum TaxID=126358 RepID=A0ABD1W114_9LAMI
MLEPFVLRKNFDFIQQFLSFDVGLQNELDKIWYFWNLGTTVTSIVDHSHFFHIKVEDPRLARLFFITSVYASCSSAERRDLWAGLHQISLSMDGPWLGGRDFKVIAHNGKRTSRNTRDSDTSNFAYMMMDLASQMQGILERVRDAEYRVDEAELDHERDHYPSHRDILHQAQAVLYRTLFIYENFWK